MEYNKDFQQTVQRRAPEREVTTKGCECELVSKKTARGGRKYSCKAVAKYVAPEEVAPPPRPAATSKPKQKEQLLYQVGDTVSVRYEDGVGYEGKITRLTTNAMDVRFEVDGSIATIPKRQYHLVTLIDVVD